MYGSSGHASSTTSSAHLEGQKRYAQRTQASTEYTTWLHFSGALRCFRPLPLLQGLEVGGGGEEEGGAYLQGELGGSGDAELRGCGGGQQGVAAPDAR